MHQVYVDLSQAKARLHLSESPFTLPEELLQVVAEDLKQSNIYPEPGSVTATQALAHHWGISEQNLVIGNGCDEIILNSFLKLGYQGTVLLSENSYPGYHELGALANQTIQYIPLGEWHVNIDKFVEYFDANTKLAVLCNPHNPIGSVLPKHDVTRFIKVCNEHDVIPVIDEAYIDFTNQIESLMHEISSFENILIWRSFAKSHGLAGIRLGAAVGSAHLIGKLKQAADSNPFSVNRISQRLVFEIAKHEDIFAQNRENVIQTRERVETELGQLGLWLIPSHTNFLFMQAPDNLTAEDLFCNFGVYVRDCAGYGFPNYWRVACGSDAEMDCFLNALKTAMQPAT